MVPVLYGLGVIAVIVMAPGGLASLVSLCTATPGERRLTSGTDHCRARGVTRRFGGLVALDHIDLDVPRGIVQPSSAPMVPGKPRCSTR